MSAAASAVASVPLPNLARQPVRRLHALTALRFFAAATIVLNHSSNVGLIPRGTFKPFLLFQAVSFFFVLSGFILAYVYPHLETWTARGRFLRARFARVWPAHVTTLALTALIITNPIGYEHHGLWGWLRPLGLNIAMLQSWFPFPRDYLAFNAVSWSISTEFGFYLMFPLLIHRFARSWWWKLPLTAALAVLMIWLGNRPGVLPFARAVPDQLDRVTAVGLVYTSPLCRVFEFTLGMTVALLWRHTTARRLGKLAGTLLELAAIALMLANMFVAARFADWAATFPRVGAAGQQWLQQGGTVCISFAILVYIMAREEGWISHALSAPLGVILGEISFSVYLMHQMLIKWYVVHADQFLALSPWLVYAFYWALVLATSYLIWAAVERPLRKAIVRGFPLWRRGSGDARTAARQALEMPGGKARSLFANLLDPGPRTILTAALLVAALTGTIFARGKFAKLHAPGSAAELQAALVQAIPSSKGVRFGNEFVLDGAVLTRTATGQDLTLYWEALRPTTLHYQVATHYLDSTGKILDQHDHPQDSANRSVAAGDYWMDTLHLPTNPALKEVAIALTSAPGQALPADRGPRDWANFRLHIPLTNDTNEGGRP